MSPSLNTVPDHTQVAQIELSPLLNNRPSSISLPRPDPCDYIPDITSTPTRDQDPLNIDSLPRPLTSPTEDSLRSGKYHNTPKSIQDGRKPNAGLKSTVTSLPPAEVSAYVDMRSPVTHSYQTRPIGKSNQHKQIIGTVYNNVVVEW